MQNDNSKITFYTQGQQLAARVLLTVWLLVSGLGSTLAAPGGQEADQATASPISSMGEVTKEQAYAALLTMKGDLNDNVLEGSTFTITKFLHQSGNPEGDLTLVLQGLIQVAQEPNTQSDVFWRVVMVLGSFFKKKESNSAQCEALLAYLQGVIQPFNSKSLHQPVAAGALASLFEKLNLAQREALLAYLQIAINTETTYQSPNVLYEVIYALGEFLNNNCEQKKRDDALIYLGKAISQGAEAGFDNLYVIDHDGKTRITAFTVLQNAIQATDLEVRKAAFTVLGRLLWNLFNVEQCDQAFSKLSEFIIKNQFQSVDEGTGSVLAAAVKAIGNLRGLAPQEQSKILSVLQTATQNSNSDVRQAAVESLRKLAVQLEDPSIVTVLQQKTSQQHEKDWEVRKRAVQSLGQLAKVNELKGKREEVSAALQNAANDSNAIVQYVVQQALQELQQATSTS